MTTSPSIFVAIASYRDPECQHTVRDLFAKAKQPERITVGICWQLDPEHDADCRVFPPPYPGQVREKHYLASESQGGCWARAESLSLLEDEDYVFQIDAHMRFAPGWDEKFIAALPGPRAGLTQHPPGYDPPGALQSLPGKRRLISAHELGGPDDPQPLHLGHIHWNEGVVQGLQATPFFVGNCLFISADAFREIPFDPHIFFRGQEPVYSARLFTHGWDLWQPEQTLAYHYWGSKSRDAGGAHYKKKNERAELGRQRVLHLLGIRDAGDPAALAELGRYGMGRERSLADFWRFAGVDLKAGSIEPWARRGRWEPWR